MINRLTRRAALAQLRNGAGVLSAAGILSGASILSGCQTSSSQQTNARIIVIGGGFGGVSAARALKQLDPALDVTLIEPNASYVACPFSNLVVAGLRTIEQQTFLYSGVAAAGIRVLPQRATAVDSTARRVSLEGGRTLAYERLIVAPGIDLRFDALDGYDENAAEQMPHAWKAGPQTQLLRAQLEAMPDGGVVAMAIPDNPYRCPPGPYERASLIAHYLSQKKPKSKLLLLDAKDRFSKKPLFEQAWKALYGDLIEWQGRGDGAAVVRVEANSNTLYTDFDTVNADVANVIPPQQAGRIAQLAGLTDGSGWCPIDAATFASSLQPDTYVIGDAAIANAMPKSAFAANAQGRLCAMQILRNLAELPPLDSTLLNTCYSLVAPGYGISVAGVYRADGALWRDQPGAGGASPLDAPAAHRELEAEYAEGWFNHITETVFG